MDVNCFIAIRKDYGGGDVTTWIASYTGTVQVDAILPSIRIVGNLLRSSKCSLLTCDSQDGDDEDVQWYNGWRNNDNQPTLNKNQSAIIK